MEAISIFDMLKVGIGPSSSHTMGPWKAAFRSMRYFADRDELETLQQVQVHLYGSLAKTGRGHGTDLAVVMGLMGHQPETIDPHLIGTYLAAVKQEGELSLLASHTLPFNFGEDIVFHFQESLPFHPNAMRVETLDIKGKHTSQTYYSIGGGFILSEAERLHPPSLHTHPLPYPIHCAEDLVQHHRNTGYSLSQIVWENEKVWRTDEEIKANLDFLWHTMQACIYRGCHSAGILPGGLHVKRRAAKINENLLGKASPEDIESWLSYLKSQVHDFRSTLKWVSCFALAVNEENASYGRIVTAPTNGAAGVIPAVMMYAWCFCPGINLDSIHTFLLVAGEIASIFKKGATISAAMGGCQAEIGVSSAMAAAGLCACLGGSLDQILMASEIAMEHHLGLTCDPIGGLVQIPCIERNSMGAIKAITACNIALESDPKDARVSLDAVIKSMWDTAQDMNSKYKETSEGGLALNISVNVAEC